MTRSGVTLVGTVSLLVAACGGSTSAPGDAGTVSSGGAAGSGESNGTSGAVGSGAAGGSGGRTVSSGGAGTAAAAPAGGTASTSTGGATALDAGSDGSSHEAHDAGDGSLAVRDASADAAAPDATADAGLDGGGPCVVGSMRCRDHNAETCRLDGTWSTSDVCSLSTQICRAGACVTNKPYLLGAADADVVDWPIYAPSANTLFLAPVRVSREASVIGVQVYGSGSGGYGRLVLYADANGVPGRLLGATAEIFIGEGADGDAVVPDPGVLVPGDVYWIGGEFVANAGTPSLYRQADPGAKVYAFARTYGAPLPDPFPSASAALQTGELSFSLAVLDVP